MATTIELASGPTSAVIADAAAAASGQRSRARSLHAAARSHHALAHARAAQLRRRGTMLDRGLVLVGVAGLGLTHGLAALAPASVSGPLLAAGLGLTSVPLIWLFGGTRRDADRSALVWTAAAAQAATLASTTGHLAGAIGAGDGDRSTGGSALVDGLLSRADADLTDIRLGMAEQDRPKNNGRRHRRIVPRQRRVAVKTSDGRTLIGNIKDVSVSGVAMAEGLPRMAVGDEAQVGRHPAVVTRIWDRGIAFAFKTELDPASFGVELVL